jgi:hypothetical protein
MESVVSGRGKTGKLQVVAPLRVKSIRLPPEAMTLRDNVNFFAVDVTPAEYNGCGSTTTASKTSVTSDASGTPWRVMRRYSDFKTLADRLGPHACSFPDAPFPKKHRLCGLEVCFGGDEAEKLENRRRELEVWLQRLFVDTSPSRCQAFRLREFVEAPASFTPTASSAYSPTVSSAPAVASKTLPTIESYGLEELATAGPTLLESAGGSKPQSYDPHYMQQ